jgi:hypothetical protein
MTDEKRTKEDLASEMLELRVEMHKLETELRKVLDEEVSTAYTREQLIDLCYRGFVSEKLWANRDSCAAQRQLGEALVLLRAGCQFSIDKQTDQHHVILKIRAQGFNYFESHDADDETDGLDEFGFYLPTPQRLTERQGKDWY